MAKSGRKTVKAQRAKTSVKRASTTDLSVKDATGVKGARKAGGEQQEYVKVTFTDLLISS